ncbi:hypothetical protein E2320_022962, partial [Naja naja]
MPLKVSLLAPLPPDVPVLLFPNSSLTLEGVIAAPFLHNSDSLKNISLAAIGGNCCCYSILLPPPDHPSLFALQQPVQNAKPIISILLNGRTFSGLIDTGADVSVIRTAEWPPSWPLSDASTVQ